MNKADSKSIIFIGSGVSSLTSAIILLREGYDVKIIEQHYQAGGYLHCFRRFGHQYDTGGHYVGAMEKGLPFHKLLNYLDVYDEDDYIELNRDAVDRYNFKDHNYTYVSGYQGNISNLSEIFPDQSQKIVKYFELIQAAAQSFPTYYFKATYDTNEVLAHLSVTLGETLNKLEIKGKLREILTAPCVLHGVNDCDVAFGIHAILIDSLIISSHGFRHGAKVLAKRFTDKIKQLGGEVILKTKIEKIEIDNDLVSKIIDDNGNEFTADYFVAGIHPKLVFNMIDNKLLKKSFKSRLAKIEESKPFIGAYLLLDKNLGIDPLSNHYFFKTAPEDVFLSTKLDRGNAIFFTCPERNYSGEGDFPLTIHASCSDNVFVKWERVKGEDMEESYLMAKEEIWSDIFDLIEGHYPGFKASIKKTCYSTPLTNKFYNPSVNGSAYGIYHDQSCTGARALGPRTHFSNLFLTGQNTLFPGILGAAISGLRTTGHFVGLKGILKELGQ